KGLGRNLTELRCPRSSGGSFRSLTASITADKRSPSFFSGFGDLLDDVDEQDENDDDDDEARLRLEPPPWPTAIIDRDESSAVDLRTRDDKDEDTVLARRAAMAKAEALQSFLGLGEVLLHLQDEGAGPGFVGPLSGLEVSLFPRVLIKTWRHMTWRLHMPPRNSLR
ncbi:hypothetical protein TorRG33x02_026130, partial [Trema orientale]